MASLNRDDMIDGLTEVVRRLRDQGATATIRIVGGAAMMLRYVEDRRITPDIDAGISTSGDLGTIVRDLAASRGWPADWLNDAAAGFIPYGGARHWESIYDDEHISVCVATPACLISMKLRASRRGRDDQDIAVLLAYLGLTSIPEVEAVYEENYPGELLPHRAYPMLEDIFATGLPEISEPPAVDLSR